MRACLHPTLSRYSAILTVAGAGYHRVGPSMWKLLLHLLLPPSVTKVIFVDTDVWIRDSLVNLWAEFEHFDAGQLIAMTLEQVCACVYGGGVKCGCTGTQPEM